MVVYRDGLAFLHGGITKPTVPCKWCGSATMMLGTKECDRHWELRSRVEGDPEIARMILAELDSGVGSELVDLVVYPVNFDQP